MDNKEKKHNISGLSFRDLAIDQEESISEGDFIFLDGDISDESDLKGVKKFFNWLVKRFNPKKGPLAFVIDFAEYIFSRLRVVWVLMSVVFDIVFNSFNLGKNQIVKKMFWGRGAFLRYVVQIASIVIVFILGISYIYRTPTIINANEEELDYISVTESDLLAMNATLNTAIPKDRERRGTDIYIVMNGDTLGTIAEKYDINVTTIKWANDLTSDLVKPGQELEIPPADGVLIKIKKGETLASVAKKYAGNEQTIADFNWLDYPFTLNEGQELFIPEGRMPEAPKPTYASTPKTYVSGSNSPSYSTYVDPNVGRFLGWPVAGRTAKISQYYKGSLHRGIDIADRNLPNILAAAGGKVVFAGCSGYCPPLGSTYGGSGYAWSIQIDHGNGYSTWYAHLKNIYVRTGQSVSAGQSIGQMGSTGRSTGPHVHFELRRGIAYGTQINPILYTNW
jgi:murein DD-endopeptidase MepM/ murein hydrolase activator NlpD